MASSKSTSPTTKAAGPVGAAKPAAVPVKVAVTKPANAKPIASKSATPKPSTPAVVPLAGSARPSAPHSAVASQPAAVSRIPSAPHPTAVPRAPKLGAAVAGRPVALGVSAARRPAAPTPAARVSVPVAAPAARPATPTAPSPVAATPAATASKPAAVTPPSQSTPATSPAKPARPAITASPTVTPTINFKLPGAVYSPQLLESVIYDIQYYIDWIRQNQIRQQVGAKPKDEPNHSDETVLVIEAWLSGKPATLDAIESLLHYLRDLKLPEIHIMLAALPNRSQRLTLVDWFRNNAGEDLLVSFVADRNLGGGIVVRTPNRVFDFSWKQELIAGRAKLAEILKRV